MFTDNLAFKSVFYKGALKKTLLFELILRLHQVHMRGVDLACYPRCGYQDD